MDDPKSFGVLDFLFKDGLQQTRIKSTTLPIWKGGEIPEITIIGWKLNIDIEFANGNLFYGGQPSVYLLAE